MDKDDRIHDMMKKILICPNELASQIEIFEEKYTDAQVYIVHFQVENMLKLNFRHKKKNWIFSGKSKEK